MNLKIYNRENSYGKRVSAHPTISFAKNARITINKVGCELLGLKAGMDISIAQDQDDKRTFYLFIDNETGFRLRDQDKGGSLAFNCSNICLAAFETQAPTCKFVAGRIINVSHFVDGITYHMIILPKAE